jgi:hypothetical protein
MVTVWNPADEGQDFIFTLLYSGGHYRIPIHLEPRATRTFNIGEIVQNPTPDAEGNVIPPTIQDGSAMIAGTHADNEGILVGLDAGTYNVRKATCTYYCITCNGWWTALLSGTPFTIPKGSGTTVQLQDQWNTGATYNLSGNYTSNNTSVATIGATNGSVNGVAPGSANFTGSGNDFVYISNYCAVDPICNSRSSPQGSGSGNVKPNVTIGSFSQNPILNGGTATVQITVDSSASISLAITSSGTGAATFDSQSGSTTKTISGTTTVTIYGSAASTNSGDLALSASYNGTTLASSPFSVTSGACKLGSEHDSGSGSKQCPSTVTLQSTYTISQYCSTCTYSCVPHTDGKWSPTGGCSAVATDIGGSLTGGETTRQTGTFSATDCNWHYAYFITTAVNAQGVPTNNAGLSIGLKCTSYGGKLCP